MCSCVSRERGEETESERRASERDGEERERERERQRERERDLRRHKVTWPVEFPWRQQQCSTLRCSPAQLRAD